MDANHIRPPDTTPRPLPRLGLLGGLVALVVAILLVPIDGAVARAMIGVRDNIGGDIKRELETLQQFGAIGSVVIVALVIWLQDPARRARLLDLLAAWLLTALAVFPLKLMSGRPRPRIALLEREPELHLIFLGPFRTYELNPELGQRHAWEFWSGISSDLHSMPSSHTAYAVVLAVFLATLYPRLRPMVLALAVIVGGARVLFGAHYPSDVVIGAAVAYAISERAYAARLWSRRLASPGERNEDHDSRADGSAPTMGAQPDR